MFAAAGDPTAAHPSTTANGQSATESHPNLHHNMAGRVEQRIAYLHAKLPIAPAQQPQWDRFVRVMRDNAQSMDQTGPHRVQTMSAMTATENMQSYAQLASTNAMAASGLR